MADYLEQLRKQFQTAACQSEARKVISRAAVSLAHINDLTRRMTLENASMHPADPGLQKLQRGLRPRLEAFKKVQEKMIAEILEWMSKQNAADFPSCRDR
jgi:hypothetical protein